ncbi:hypothetical protein E2C01_096064 [Portunus trituberculatus]|uniref:Uncharacterized protein n=1 Tax=Portunus trituberculatus TaxID=210409 RepID=A0A5B7JX03_PORTR|nr:hypothetical protein [Portunus trituberculatus]
MTESFKVADIPSFSLDFALPATRSAARPTWKRRWRDGYCIEVVNPASVIKWSLRRGFFFVVVEWDNHSCVTRMTSNCSCGHTGGQ